MSLIGLFSPLISSVALVGGQYADAVVVEHPHSQPAAVYAGHEVDEASHHGEGCGCDSCGKRGGLLTKLFARKHKADCDTCETCQQPAEDCGCKKPGLLARIKSRFGRKKSCAPCEASCACDSGGVASVSMVNEEPTPVAAIVHTEAPKMVEAPKPAPPKMDHAADYSWIQGKLEYAHIEGGAWILRYAGLDQSDKYGGHVVLSRSAKMANYREGDMVRVEGEIVNDRSSIFLRGPLYRVYGSSMVQAGVEREIR